MCIFTVKSLIKYYTKQNSTVLHYSSMLLRPFDRVNHWTLFSKMIKKNVPMVIVRVIAFGINCNPCVLNGVKLTLIILMFQMA